MKTFHLLEGKLQLTNTKLEITQVSHWSLISSKLLSIVAGMYIFDRTTSKIERGFDTFWDIIFTSIVYVPLSIFVIYLLYREFILKNWTNSMNVDSIISVTETIDEENPLNITLIVKSRFSSLDLSFRKSEHEHVAFLESLQKLNSRYTVHQETL